jgi:predicted alpha/beta hydrolase
VNAPGEASLHVPDVEEHRLRVPARDCYPLAATLYVRAGQVDPEDVVVFNTGGGLAARRYAHFLRYLAGEGLPVLAYDYRGVGGSRPERLRGFVAGLEDWAEYDQAGVIDFARERYPRARLSSVSHSIGCLVACTAPNASMLHQMVYIGPHTGYWGDYRPPWKWPMALAWHVLMPLVARACGYFPGAALRLGDDFPLRFALQWAGRRRGEFAVSSESDIRAARLLDECKSTRVPALALTFQDDSFVGDIGATRFLRVIPEAPVVRRHLARPTQFKASIGHFGFFVRRSIRLWPIVVRFLRPVFALK